MGRGHPRPRGRARAGAQHGGGCRLQTPQAPVCLPLRYHVPWHGAVPTHVAVPHTPSALLPAPPGVGVQGRGVSGMWGPKKWLGPLLAVGGRRATADGRLCIAGSDGLPGGGRWSPVERGRPGQWSMERSAVKWHRKPPPPPSVGRGTPRSALRGRSRRAVMINRQNVTELIFAATGRVPLRAMPHRPTRTGRRCARGCNDGTPPCVGVGLCAYSASCCSRGALPCGDRCLGTAFC